MDNLYLRLTNPKVPNCRPVYHIQTPDEALYSVLIRGRQEKQVTTSTGTPKWSTPGARALVVFTVVRLALAWPKSVFSLSRVALPFPPDDPLYGSVPPQGKGQLFLGKQALQGERNVLKISGDFLLCLCYNPCYDYIERRVLDWITTSPETGRTLAEF